MTRQTIAWLVTVFSAGGLGLLIGMGASGGSVGLMVILSLLMFAGIGWAMRRQVDAAWISLWVVLGFVAKLVGTYARHWMVIDYYGVGDSIGYYRAGLESAELWRQGTVPALSGRGSFGTQIVEQITGGFFAIFTPDMMGGFLMFAILSFFGQLMMYAAFRRWAAPHQLKPYATLIFFLPTYMFWPSSIGKDAVVVFALGGAAYFASRTLQAFAVRWIPGLVLFLTLLGLIRIHVAGLVVAGLVVAGLIARLPAGVDPVARIRRLIFVGVGVIAALVVLTFLPEVFGVDLSGEEGLDAFTSDVVRRTSESGTIAEGGAVNGPADLPEAISLVLFQPFPWRARELQHYFAAAETTLLLGMTLWMVPSMLRNWRSWRRNGYVVFSTIYVLGYAIAFSVVRNLGIVARQRGQVLGFFLCVLISLGWERRVRARPQIPAIRSRSQLDAGAPRGSIRQTENVPI